MKGSWVNQLNFDIPENPSDLSKIDINRKNRNGFKHYVIQISFTYDELKSLPFKANSFEEYNQFSIPKSKDLKTEENVSLFTKICF